MALEFLDEAPQEPEAVVTPEPEIEAPAEPEPPPEPEVVRDEQGRFAPKQTMVPLAALEAERQRAQGYQRQLQEREERDEDTPWGRRQQDPVVEAQNIALNVKLDISEDLARAKHGEEAVDTARDWALQRFAQSPSFQQEVLSQRNPYEYIVSQFKRDQMIAQVTPDDFAQFQAWKAQQANSLAPPAQPQPAPVAPQPVAPPRSLASAPAAGTAKPGAPPVYQGAAFDTVFRN